MGDGNKKAKESFTDAPGQPIPMMGKPSQARGCGIEMKRPITWTVSHKVGEREGQ